MNLSRLSTTNIMFFLLSMICFILPFLYLPQLQDGYERPKYIAFIFFTILVGIIMLYRVYKYDEEVIEKKPLFLLLGLYLLINLISDIVGLNIQRSLLGTEYRYQGFITLICSVITFLSCFSLKKNPVILNRFYLLFSIVSGIISIFLVYQAVAMYIFHQLFPMINNRLVLSFGNPNLLGGFLAIIFPFTLFYKPQKPLHTYIQKIIVVISSVAILVTMSRGAITAAGCAVILLTLLKIKHTFKKILIIICVSIIIIFSLRIFYRGSIWESRGLIWKYAAPAIIQRPLLGYGQGNVQQIFPPDLLIAADDAHNIFLEVILSTGIIGLVVFAAFIVTVFTSLSLEGKIWLVVFLVRAQFNPLSIAEVAYFWILMGLLQRKDYLTGS